jgi:hypothetical protein
MKPMSAPTHSSVPAVKLKPLAGPEPTDPVPDPAAAKLKIEAALELLGPARHDNQELLEIYEEAQAGLEGYEPDLRAIKFDRGSRDVSSHGTALREKASHSSEVLGEGSDELSSVKQKTPQMQSLVEGALADLAGGNTKAARRLGSALNDLLFVQDGTLLGLDMALNRSSHLLGEELDPFLVEVEEDAPGRDVGRFADDIEEIWLLTGQQLKAGPVYSRSAERHFESADTNLVRALEEL